MLFTLEEAREFVDTVLDCIEKIKELPKDYQNKDDFGNISFFGFCFNEHNSIGETTLIKTEPKDYFYFHKPNSEQLRCAFDSTAYECFDLKIDIDEAWLFQQSLLHENYILNYFLIAYMLRKSTREVPKYIGFNIEIIENVLLRLKEREEELLK